MTNSGTTSWSVAVTNLLLPGSYTIQAIAVDQTGASTLIEGPLTILDLRIIGSGSVSLTNGGVGIANPLGYALQYGDSYEVTATPAAGQTFVNWTYGDFVTPSTILDFMYDGGLLTATFIPTNVPKGTKGIYFTYPPANARLMTGSFQMKGRIAASVKSAEVTCQIISRNTGIEAGPPLVTSGTTSWSVPVTNLPPDDYLVEAVATNAQGFSTVIFDEFSVLDFKGVTGTYSGLFICDNPEAVSPTNSGYFTCTVSASGAFSGKLLFPAYRPIVFASARFDADGDAGTYSTPYFLEIPGNGAYFYMSLDLTGVSGELTGSVYSTNAAGWVSPLTCYRAVTKLSAATPAKGKYILSLDPINWPNTNGYTSLSIGSSGNLALSGALPDGASFSQSVGISKNGIWPLYVIPSGYKTGGMLMGWEFWQTNGLGSYTGQLYWLKKQGIGKYLTNTVDNSDVVSTGTNYVSPTAGSNSIIFQGGAISVPVTNMLTFVTEGKGGQFKPQDVTDKLAISLSANGVINGHFVNDDKTMQFKGAFFGQSQGGSGFILEGNGQTGYFLLTP